MKSHEPIIADGVVYHPRPVSDNALVAVIAETSSVLFLEPHFGQPVDFKRLGSYVKSLPMRQCRCKECHERVEAIRR